jgi:hypothetical protein
MANATQSRFAAPAAPAGKLAVGGISVTANEKEGTMTIVLPLQPAGTMSKTGKSQLLASTNGNKTVRIGDIHAKLGVNCYVEV